MTSSGLKSSLLRGTVLVNHFQGPFRSGRFGFELSFGTHFHVCWLNHYFMDVPNQKIGEKHGQTFVPTQFIP